MISDHTMILQMLHAVSFTKLRSAGQGCSPRGGAVGAAEGKYRSQPVIVVERLPLAPVGRRAVGAARARRALAEENFARLQVQTPSN